MKKDRLFHIQNDKEVNRIYKELREGFMAYIKVSIPALSEEEREEIYNDSFLALCDNISSGKLQTLTCSLQTYINQIGRNKSVSLLRSKEDTQPLPDYELLQWQHNLGDSIDDDELSSEKQEEIYKLVIEMENDTCKKVLFGFYWHHYSMDTLAELIGAASADVAKTTKNRCLTKLKNAAYAVFRKKGLI